LGAICYVIEALAAARPLGVSLRTQSVCADTAPPHHPNHNLLVFNRRRLVRRLHFVLAQAPVTKCSMTDKANPAAFAVAVLLALRYGGSAMNLLNEALGGLGAALLPVVAGLLLEELTFGGLVRLLIAPWPGIRKKRGRKNRRGEGK